MEDIRKAVDSLWENAPKTLASFEFKEELLSNCIARYQDLIENGMNNDEAYRTVMNSIGDVSELWNNLSGTQEKQEEGLSRWRKGRTSLFPFLDSELVNKKVLQSQDINRIEVIYASESVQILHSDTDDIILEEYFSNWDESMLANITQHDGILYIKYGARPLFNIMGFDSHIKLYLPNSYKGAISVETISGSIRTSIDMALSSIKMNTLSGSVSLCNAILEENLAINTKSGSVQLGNIKAPKGFEAKTASGSIRAGQLITNEFSAVSISGTIAIEGVCAKKILCHTTSGTIKIEGAFGNIEASSISGSIKINGGGSGKFCSTSGGIYLYFNKVDGDIDAKSTSGSVKLTLPRTLSFFFDGSTVSGRVSTYFEDYLSFNKKCNKGTGQIGTEPTCKINLSSVSGSVHVK